MELSRGIFEEPTIVADEGATGEAVDAATDTPAETPRVLRTSGLFIRELAANQGVDIDDVLAAESQVGGTRIVMGLGEC